MRSGSWPSLCWWGSQPYDLSRSEEQQNDDNTTRDGRKTSQEEGKDTEPKQTVKRNEVACLFACCFGVIRCDMA